jgi:hypothetical protein
MSIDNTSGSEFSGSPSTGPDFDTNAPTGQPASQSASSVDLEKQYRELEQRFGQQGRELGEYRTFFENVSPLLDKLDSDPVLVQAILDNKIDSSLVQAVVDGKISLGDAEVVTEAKGQAVAEAGGEKKFSGLSSAEAERLIEKKVQEVRRELEENVELKSFEEKTTKFIDSTPDFVEYADEIDKWLDSHNIADIEVAYYAVKGKMSEESAKRMAEEEEAERAKQFALNAQGGGVTSQYADDGTPIIDKLVGGNNSPNRLW